MKKHFMFFALTVFAASMAHGQYVDDKAFEGFSVRFSTPDLKTVAMPLGDGEAAMLDMDGYMPAGEVGAPALPVSSHLVSVPYCDSVSVVVRDAVYDTMAFPGAKFYPLQPSRLKSDSLRHAPVVDADRYGRSEFYSLPLAEVVPMGEARDRKLAMLRFSPVQVNPVEGKVVVCRNATVEVVFHNADAVRTLDRYERYHTPAFTSGTTLNDLYAKATDQGSPLRMVVVVGNGLESASGINDFVAWKRKRGLIVDVWNYSTYGSTSALAAALRSLYENASTESPAPLYVILVGDHQQLPAFNHQMSSSFMNQMGLDAHVSDHYYVSWTDDMLRDAYVGRFSAGTASELNNIIGKTLLYEKYGFSDDSYLEKAILIAGVDNEWTTNESYNSAYRCADPTMDYLAKSYINADNGYSDVKYYKNRTSFAPTGVSVTGSSSGSNVASTLRGYYNAGVGWINYSAHGLPSGWGDPSFNVTNANAMTNNGKPSIMIGNCCLSNAFHNTTCLGEALIRKGDNAGAVAYVGATNSTTWDEDFYWSVGFRSRVYGTMNATYDGNNRGSYDAIFHTHGESFSQSAFTMGSYLHAGLMAVNMASSTSTFEAQLVEYYWEIYELMGDPSLMPWLGRADDLPDASLARGQNNTVVYTLPYAYVALYDTVGGELLAANFSNANGQASLPVPQSKSLDGVVLSVALQGYKPYLRACRNISVAIADVENMEVTLSPNPASSSFKVTAEGLSLVEVVDPTGRVVMTRRAHGDSLVLPVDGLAAGVFFVRVHGQAGVAVKKLVVCQ